MLVLTRKCQEAVVVGETDKSAILLKVTVLDIGNGRVRLGFEARDDVPVHRLEVWERIRAFAQDNEDEAAIPGVSTKKEPRQQECYRGR